MPQHQYREYAQCRQKIINTLIDMKNFDKIFGSKLVNRITSIIAILALCYILIQIIIAILIIN